MISPEIQNQLRSQYNPDGSDLRKIQLRMLDILVEFDRVCRLNGITYWLDSGTLIGAARHGGFIPWDDDLDVCILRSDYRKLCRAIRKDLRAPYSFYDQDSTDQYARRWPRIVDESVIITRLIPDSGNKGAMVSRKDNLWIDVFQMIEGSVRTSKVLNSFYGRCYRRKFRLINDGALRHAIGVVLYPLARCICSMARLTGRIFHRGNYIHDFGAGFYSTRKKRDLFPLGTIEFESHIFPAPGNVHAYLTGIYGDYMKLPDADKRQTHNFTDIKFQ